MKAVITYNLPEDDMAYKRCFMSWNMAIALYDIEQYLRSIEKNDLPDDIEKIRSKFYAILEDYDINLDNLVE